MFNALGANPLQMSFADLQPALSTGAVDGQENPINLFLAFKMDTLAQKHLTIWNYCADAGIFHVAKSVWDTFSKADQDIITESAEAANGRSRLRAGIGVDGDTPSLKSEETRQKIADLTRRRSSLRHGDAPVFDKRYDDRPRSGEAAKPDRKREPH